MRHKITLFVILLVAALFRLYNIDYALPEIFEEATPMRQAWEMWNWDGAGFDFNPHFFNYPALFFYIQFLGQTVYFIINFLTGRYADSHTMHAAFESDPSEIVLLARLITVAFGLGTTWATYRLGQKCVNPTVGLVAAAAMAVAQIPIATSRTILVDVPLVFFGVLALAEIIEPKLSQKDCIKIGLWIGLAASSKYTGALFLIPFIAAHLLTYRFQRLPQLIWGMAVSALVFLLTSPYCLLDFSAFWADFSYERTHMAMGHFGIDATRTELTYAKDLYNSLQIGLVLASVIGLIWIPKHCRTHKKYILPIVIFIVAYLATISTWAVHAAHYLLPAFPPLLVIAAMGLHQMTARFSLSKGICVPLAMLILLPASMQSYHFLAESQRPDARIEAKKWIEAHIPTGSLIVVEFYTPDLKRDAYHIARLPMDIIRPNVMAPFYDINWYADFDYIIISEGVSARYKSDPQKFAPQIQFYNALKEQWQHKISFVGETYSGPGIHIYQRSSPRLGQPKLLTPKQYETLVGVDIPLAQGLLGQLARLFQKKGWFEKAIDLYSHMLAITPDRADIRAELGMLFYESGYSSAAEKAFEEALQGDVERPDYVRGTLHFIRGQADSAIAAWESDLIQHGDDLSLLTNLGAMYFQRGDTLRAIQLWEDGLRQDPTDPDLINNLLYIYQAQNKTEQAIQMLNTALNRHPDNLELRRARDALTKP